MSGYGASGCLGVIGRGCPEWWTGYEYDLLDCALGYVEVEVVTGGAESYSDFGVGAVYEFVVVGYVECVCDCDCGVWD